MFKSLKSGVVGKQVSLKIQSEAQKKSQTIVAKYYSRAVAVYHPTHYTLTITTPSKAAASELLLQSGELSADLRQAGVAIKKLIIR